MALVLLSYIVTVVPFFTSDAVIPDAFVESANLIFFPFFYGVL